MAQHIWWSGDGSRWPDDRGLSGAPRRLLWYAMPVRSLSLLFATSALANNQPVVSNVVAQHRASTTLVDVTFDLADADALYVTMWYALDGGESWEGECVTVSGDVGAGVMPGTGLSATWDAADITEREFMLRVYADDGS